MKKILVMILCVIMAAMPAAAEGITEITIEQVENLAAELGFEGANGEETVIPAGEGYFVLWREDLPALYVYSPDDGWHAVDGSGIDEEWALTELDLYYQNKGESTSFADERVAYCGSVGTAYASRCRPSDARKGLGFILVDNLMVDLNDYGVYTPPTYLLSIYVSNDGRLFTYNENSDLIWTQIDAKGNEVGKVDFSALEPLWIHGFNISDEGTAVVYSADGADSSATYAAWIDNDGNIVQNSYLCKFAFSGVTYYAEAYDAMVFYRELNVKRSYLCVAYRDGTTKAIFYDNATGEYINIAAEEVEFDKDGLKNQDVKVPMMAVFEAGSENMLMVHYTGANENGLTGDVTAYNFADMSIKKIPVEDSVFNAFLDLDYSGGYVYDRSEGIIYKLAVK